MDAPPGVLIIFQHWFDLRRLVQIGDGVGNVWRQGREFFYGAAARKNRILGEGLKIFWGVGLTSAIRRDNKCPSAVV